MTHLLYLYSPLLCALIRLLLEIDFLARVSPTQADFLYAYATVDEYMSNRTSQKGSYFVCGLVEAFRERATRDHLLDILTNVNKGVGEMVATQPALENKTEIKDLK